MHKSLKPYSIFRIFRAFRRQSFKNNGLRKTQKARKKAMHKSLKPYSIFRVFRAFRRQSFVVVFAFFVLFAGSFNHSHIDLSEKATHAVKS